MDQKDRNKLVKTARKLFMSKGFDNVGMRELANSVGLQPTQLYRLNLTKSNILAEVIISHNALQLEKLPSIVAKVQGDTAFSKVCVYLELLYEQDIQHLQLRSIGAIHGWTWTPEYEKKIVSQIYENLQPIKHWFLQAELSGVDERSFGVWSLYYMGFRQAVVHKKSAKECLSGIQGSLRYLCE